MKLLRDAFHRRVTNPTSLIPCCWFLGPNLGVLMVAQHCHGRAVFRSLPPGPIIFH